MGLDLEYIDGQTPIDEEEKEGLLIQTISTKAELDEFEQQNIEEAMQWVIGKKFNAQEIFSEKFICNLHRRMYGEVWNWAGKFRKTNKNLGVDRFQIATELHKLCNDALLWHQHGIYPPTELAVRFKHRIVSIHCFSNGNGRHSRLMADVISEKLYGKPPFSWGGSNLSKQGEARKRYLAAVREADNHNINNLIEFASS